MKPPYGQLDIKGVETENIYMSNLSCLFWTSYWGHLATEEVQGQKFEIHGYENLTADFSEKSHVEFTGNGTIWGFVHQGQMSAETSELEWMVRPGQWFSFPYQGTIKFDLKKNSKVWMLNGVGHKGLSCVGGPVESKGRLRYIDGCTDTLLYCPPVIGDPCLNLLHFPSNVDQTDHFHPTSRSGMIHRGHGSCVSAQDDGMKEGTIFYLPANVRHKFKTTTVAMDVISFHPDSDWGPTHEVHPMINRTWGTNDDSQ